MLDTPTAVFSDSVVMDGFLSIKPWLTYLPAFFFLGLQSHMFSTYIQYLCLHTDLIVVETYLLHKLSCLPAAPHMWKLWHCWRYIWCSAGIWSVTRKSVILKLIQLALVKICASQWFLADRTCFCQNVCLTLRLIKVTSDPARTQLKAFLALHDTALGHESQMSRRPANSLNLLLQFGRDCCITSFKENLIIICIS
jgi:hypothetical protein